MSDLRIAFVGDSYVNGTGDPDGLGWRGRACAAAMRRGHRLTHYDLGVRGDTSGMVRQRWRAEAEARFPAGSDGRLVFSFGLNDSAEVAGAGLRLAPDESEAIAAAMLAEAAAWRPTLWVGPPPANEAMSPMTPTPGFTVSFADDRVADLNRRYTAAAARLGIPYLDIFGPLAGEAAYRDDQTKGDGLHCGAPGYAMIAALFEGWPAWREWLP